MNKFFSTAVGSLIKVFLSGMLAQYIAMGKGVFDITADGWKSIVGAGIAAAVLVGYNALNPTDPRYGNKKNKE